MKREKLEARLCKHPRLFFMKQIMTGGAKEKKRWSNIRDFVDIEPAFPSQARHILRKCSTAIYVENKKPEWLYTVLDKQHLSGRLNLKNNLNFQMFLNLHHSQMPLTRHATTLILQQVDEFRNIIHGCMAQTSYSRLQKF